jgi:PPOX class probable F420-dependent enzyme
MPFEMTEQIHRHLTKDRITWLTTVTPSGKPAPRPVWFTWDGVAIMIHSQNNGKKLLHIAQNDNVTLTFGPAPLGNDAVTIIGHAVILPDTPRPSQVPAMVEKYKDVVVEIGQDIDWYDSNFSTAILVIPERAWVMPD